MLTKFSDKFKNKLRDLEKKKEKKEKIDLYKHWITL